MKSAKDLLDSRFDKIIELVKEFVKVNHCIIDDPDIIDDEDDIGTNIIDNISDSKDEADCKYVFTFFFFQYSTDMLPFISVVLFDVAAISGQYKTPPFNLLLFCLYPPLCIIHTLHTCHACGITLLLNAFFCTLAGH